MGAEPAAIVIALPGPGGKSSLSWVSTWRLILSAGSTVASTVVNLMPRNGSPASSSTSALSAATGPGRRITKRDSRYQKPCSVGRDSRSRVRCSQRGASEFTRWPSRTSTAGSTTSATNAAISATIEPPRPIE